MWQLFKPSDDVIQRFLASQKIQDFSYSAIGSSAIAPPEGYTYDSNRILLGRGNEIFETACDAIRQWRMFPQSWTQVFPSCAQPEVGCEVVTLARAMGIWWLNACRIVYVVDEYKPVRRYGFAYGTLTDHVESGEERFSIVWDEDDQVWYEICAFSRPRFWLARLAYPLTRHLQHRFALNSMQQMQDILADAQLSLAQRKPVEVE